MARLCGLWLLSGLESSSDYGKIALYTMSLNTSWLYKNPVRLYCMQSLKQLKIVLATMIHSLDSS